MSRPRELLTDYARGALPEADAVRLEEHLRTCPSCRGEIREVREGFVELVEGLPRAPVPPEAWSGIVERVRSQKLGTSRRIAWGLAASLVLVAVLGLWSFQFLQSAARADVEAQTVARWLARDDVSRVSLGIYPSGGYGSVLVLPDGRTLFILDDGPGRWETYQAWGERDGELVSLGTFRRPVFETDTSGFEAVGVSLEPRGGSPQPTHLLGEAELP